MSQIRFQFLYIIFVFIINYIVAPLLFSLCDFMLPCCWFGHVLLPNNKVLKLLRYLVIRIVMFPFVFWCFKMNSLLWQIRLWESDLNRVEMTPAHYYDEFPSRVLTIQYVWVICLTSYSHDCIWLFPLSGRTSSRLLVTTHGNGTGCCGRIRKPCV